jgi:hypothetical protein
MRMSNVEATIMDYVHNHKLDEDVLRERLDQYMSIFDEAEVIGEDVIAVVKSMKREAVEMAYFNWTFWLPGWPTNHVRALLKMVLEDLK